MINSGIVCGSKCDDLPEQAFMMAGTIEDVREKRRVWQREPKWTVHTQ